MTVLDSPRHPQLDAYAAAHARWMAEHNRQLHDKDKQQS